VPEPQQRILVVDDDPQIVAGLAALLSLDWEVKTATTGKEALATFADFSPDVVLLDVQLPDFSGIELLHQFKMYSETVAVIMMSGVGGLDRVIESMRLGAETFLQKPFEYDILTLTLQQVSRILATQRELLAFKRNEGVAAERLPGVSPSITQLNDILLQIARAPSPVLIEGESGTGKGVFAKLVHDRSPRARAPFVDLNCAGLSKELLESELFGHERGAFTGAQQQRRGRFEQAEGGTLFLDEIGDMPADLQTRLLRVLSENSFYRVGGHQQIKANVRVIAATHQNLESRVREGSFREDLYHRLNVIRIRLPSLSERREDVPLLAKHFLAHSAKQLGVEPKRLSEEALEHLSRLEFPGNVRQLENLCHWLTVMAPGQVVELGDLPAEFRDPAVASAATDWVAALEQEAERRLARGETGILDALGRQFERTLIAKALARTGGRRIEAASLLGMGRNTITRKIQELGIEGDAEE